MTDKLIRIATVMNMTGKSRSSIYADIASDTFPPSILIGARSVAWSESSITTWIASKIDAAKQITKQKVAVSQDELIKRAAALKAKEEADSI